MLLELPNFHPREGEYLWLPKAQPPWGHASTSCPEGRLGSGVTRFTKGLPSLGTLGWGDPELTCPVWWPFLSPQLPAVSTTLCSPVSDGERVPHIPPPLLGSMAAAAQNHWPRTEVGKGRLAPEHLAVPPSLSREAWPRLVGSGTSRKNSCVCRFSAGGGLRLLATHREGPGGSGPGLG